jgi:hypothetical protein
MEEYQEQVLSGTLLFCLTKQNCLIKLRHYVTACLSWLMRCHLIKENWRLEYPIGQNMHKNSFHWFSIFSMIVNLSWPIDASG